MQIVVISDSHMLVDEIKQVRMAHPHADAYLHCGDSELSPNQLDGFISVLGNNDDHVYPEELVIDIKGIKVYMTHSHLFSYHNRIEKIARRAKEKGCMIALFGHSHRFFVEEIEGVMCVNPGSMRYNRDGSPACYALITLENEVISEVERINL